jgi:hypothetical protein
MNLRRVAPSLGLEFSFFFNSLTHSLQASTLDSVGDDESFVEGDVV